MFLLDTNVVSELRKVRSGKANLHVARWSKTVDGGTLYISAITVLELDVGVLRLERRDIRQGQIMRTWLESYVLLEFKDRTFPVDSTVARRCAPLHVPDPRPERDALIAATALVHGMIVVTRNVEDFAATGVRLFNPWEADT